MRKGINKLLFLLIFAISFASCQKRVAGEAEKCVTVTNIDEPIDMRQTDFVTDFSLVQPEKNALIGEVHKVVQMDSLLYLFDKEQMEVNIINLKGKLVNKISRRGHGHEEYIDLADVFVDFENSTFNLLSRQRQSLFVYDKSGRKLLRILKTPKRFVSMEKMPKGYIGYMGNYSEDKEKPYNFWTLDEEMNLCEGFSTIDPSYESRYKRYVNVFSAYSGKINALTDPCYKIQTIDNKGCAYSYEFDFGEKELPEQTEKQRDNVVAQARNAQEYITALTRFQETSSCLWLFIQYKFEEKAVVYDKHTKQTSVVALNGIKDLYPISFGNIVGSCAEALYTTIDAERVHAIHKGKDEYNDFENMFPKEVSNIRQIVSVDYDNINPYICIYNIR